MKGVYTAKHKASGVSSAKTLIYLTNTSSKVLEILSAGVTNASNATNQQFECTLQRISSLGTPTATSLTPSKHETGDQSSTITAKGNVTASEPTYSSDTEIGYSGEPTLGGWKFDPIPEERMYVEPSASIGLRLLTAISSADLTSYIRYREIG